MDPTYNISKTSNTTWSQQVSGEWNVPKIAYRDSFAAFNTAK